MRKIICFKIDPKMDLENAWQMLSEGGYTLLYSSEEETGEKEIYAEYSDTTDVKKKYSFVRDVANGILPEIDWDAQWETHGANFKEGFVHINLNPYGYSAILKLQPGPGFGDLSHPTTHLVLEMMPGWIEGKPVLDVGSGSGVLSFAAEAMGASRVHGIDIDSDAIKHANENAQWNSSSATFSLPDAKVFFEYKECVILMNMIQSEQMEAWKELRKPSRAIVITSGILKEGREDYLKMVQKWGLKLLSEKEKNGWCGFVFATA